MDFAPYISFNGNCAEAFKFYEQLLGAKIAALMKYSDSPDQEKVTPELRDQVMHARLDIGPGLYVMASDAPHNYYRKPQGFNLSLGLKSVEEAERVFNALAAGGQIHMPLGKTFWSPMFGVCVDRFGIPWMVNVEAGH